MDSGTRRATTPGVQSDVWICWHVLMLIVYQAPISENAPVDYPPGHFRLSSVLRCSCSVGDPIIRALACTTRRFHTMSETALAQAVAARRTFAIISHPDAAQPFNA